MTPRCFQSLDNGQRCNAPAIQGSKFCRHHDPRNMALKEATPKSPEHTPLTLPELVDKPSMLAALNQVYIALGEGRIKRSVAHTLLSAIKLADRLVTEIAAAGETGIPTSGRFQPATMALAASGYRPDGNPAHLSRYRASLEHAFDVDNDIDPTTARIVRELVAQSHSLDRTHTTRAGRQ